MDKKRFAVWVDGRYPRIFFGSAQKLLLEDERIRKIAHEIAEGEKPIFCKYISDQEGNSEQIAELGMDVQYVGSIISDFIKDGYVSMVF